MQIQHKIYNQLEKDILFKNIPRPDSGLDFLKPDFDPKSSIADPNPVGSLTFSWIRIQLKMKSRQIKKFTSNVRSVNSGLY